MRDAVVSQEKGDAACALIDAALGPDAPGGNEEDEDEDEDEESEDEDME